MKRRPDLVIEGNVLLPSGPDRAAIGIDTDTGHITAVKRTLMGGERITLSGGLIVPAAVDLHVHFREPGLTAKEDLATGSRAALHGGVVRVVEMPNTKPPATTAQELAEKRSRARAKSVVDIAIAAGLTRPGPSNALLEAPFLKAYLGPTTGGLRLAEDDLPRLAAHLTESGYKGVTVFHAESHGLVDEEAHDLEGHNAARPPEAELRAVEGIVNAFRKPLAEGRLKVHMAHCSTTGAAARALPAGMTAGATPHHLLLDVGRGLGTRGKCNPPLRTSEERDALWRRFAEEELMVESDHAPHLPEEKDVPFDEAPSGVPGVETTAPLLMALAFAGEIKVRRAVEAFSLAPSRLVGAPLGIQEGREASLAFFRRRDIGPIEASVLVTKCGWSPFEGMDACFPREVVLRGDRVVEEGEITAVPGKAQVW